MSKSPEIDHPVKAVDGQPETPPELSLPSISPEEWSKGIWVSIARICRARESGYRQVLTATQTPGEAGKNWFQGTVDVVRQFHWLFEAIWEVGEVIQFYDSDRRFPSWGFGGKKPDGSVSHCFDLIRSCSEVELVERIMSSYACALHTVALLGPTLFRPVINSAAEIAGRSISSSINCK